MAILTLRFRKRGPNGRRLWFLEICDFCRGIYGDDKHDELRRSEEACDLHIRDFVDLILTTALPDCRIHHGKNEIEVEIDFDNDADAVAFHLRYVNFG